MGGGGGGVKTNCLYIRYGSKYVRTLEFLKNKKIFTVELKKYWKG